MPLHVPLSHLHRERHLPARFDPRDFSSLGLSNQLGIVDDHACTLAKLSEKFKTSVVFDWREHSDSFLNHARLYRNMGASVGFNILIPIRVQISAVDNNLRPAMRVH